MIASSPLIKDGILYFCSGDFKLYAISLDTKKTLWTFTAGGPLITSPIEYQGQLFFGGSDCKLYCSDLNGTLLWTFKTSISTPARIGFSQTSSVPSAEVVISEFLPEEKKEQYHLPTLDESDSEYKIKSDYIVKSKYTKNRKVKSMSSGWDD